MFVFFYSHTIFAILALSHSAACSCLSPTVRKAWALRLAPPPFIPFVGLDIVLVETLIGPTRWASIFVAPFLAMPMGLPCWPIGLITFPVGLPWPIYFTFTSYYAHEPSVCHSYHAGSLDLLPLFLRFHGPFALLLPLVVPMSLLAVISAMLAHWVCYLYSWASIAYLLYFYFLLCPWACWLSFLPCWSLGLLPLFSSPRPIYFTFTSSIALFLSPSLIVGLLLPLGYLSKMGINNL